MSEAKVMKIEHMGDVADEVERIGDILANTKMEVRVELSPEAMSILERIAVSLERVVHHIASENDD